MSDDRIEGTLKDAAGHVQDAVGGLTGAPDLQAKGKLNQASGTAQDMMGQAKDKALDVSGDLHARVKDQPMAALGVALGVGVVLGLLLSGGRKTVYVRK